jgi:hypothetical protein
MGSLRHPHLQRLVGELWRNENETNWRRFSVGGQGLSGIKKRPMPQVQLPIFPAGSVEINRDLACRTEGDQVIYYNGHLPVFTHAKNDLGSFRLFTSQLIVQGSATQGHVAKAFGVPLVAIKRSTKLYRQRGAAGFFVPKARREGLQLNAEKLEQARALLVQGHPLAVVSRQTGVLSDTLRKAIQAGRLPAVKKRTKRSARLASP